ncbi:mite group 2 allergen Tyr p 2 isoform X2 [Procambarus clarkii]|nr:mite group 2 allergen Tyr p 2-like [Procambarus clarkii]
MHRLLVPAVLLAATVSATLFQDCGSVGSMVSLEVDGCDVPPCEIHRGHTVNTSLHFTPSRDSETLTVKVTANVGGFDLPWEGLDPNACHFTPCPLVQGIPVTAQMPIKVLDEYPALSTIVTIKLEDVTGEPQACIVLPIVLV